MLYSNGYGAISNSNSYNFTRFYVNGKTDGTYLIGTDHEFRILVSNDGAVWEIMKTFTLNEMIIDTSRTISNHGIIGQVSDHSMYYISWTNTSYYSMWIVQHTDIGSSSNMVIHENKYMINLDYFMGEIEWG